jgi:predicted HTH domain antitoxin
MSVTFSLTERLENTLREEQVDLAQLAREATLVALFRQGKISTGQMAECLETSRYEVDGILKRYNVTDDLLTWEELQEQVRGLRESLEQ